MHPEQDRHPAPRATDPPGFSLADILDLRELQEIQDSFARACGIASTISDTFGNPLTEPSNHCRVCRIVRSTPRGLARCRLSARTQGERSRASMKPNFSPCQSIGFVDACAPIVVDGHHIANWLIGQNYIGRVDEARVEAYAGEIGADPGEMIEAFREMPKIDRRRFEDILDFLWRMANQISALGYRNLRTGRLVEELEQSRDSLLEYQGRLEVLVEERTRKLQQALQEVRRLSTIDGLTGCFNRAYINDRLPQEVKRSRRYGRPLSLILCDVDHFKSINDRFGHQAGDEALEWIARSLREGVRDGVDWVGRYGGEEFLVVLPETSAEGGREVAERLRRSVAAPAGGDPEQRIRLTASFGVSSLQPGSGAVGAADLLSRADACLYLAKERGRNRVVAESDAERPE